MRLDKPIGTLLLLWPTYWALFLSADGWPDFDLLIIFTLGVIVMRTAGCVINDFADRNIDKYIKRTKDRPLTSGEISPKSALVLFVMLLFQFLSQYLLSLGAHRVNKPETIEHFRGSLQPRRLKIYQDLCGMCAEIHVWFRPSPFPGLPPSPGLPPH